MSKSKILRIICLALVLIFVIPTNFSINVSADNTKAEMTRDICIYTQWDSTVHQQKNGTKCLCTSGCRWFSFAHAMQWLGFEDKDVETRENGHVPLPDYYMDDLKKGCMPSLDTICNYLEGKYDTLKTAEGNSYTIEEGLGAGKVAILSGYGHVVLAVEVSSDGNYVHIIDSVLSIAYKSFDVYYKTVDGNFVKIEKNSKDFVDGDKIAQKKHGITCYASEPVKDRKAQTVTPRYKFSGGDYWVKWSDVKWKPSKWLYSTESPYLSECTKYASYTDITLKSSGTANVKSLPLGASQASSIGLTSDTVEVGLNKTYTATALYKNTFNGYWYKVKTQSGKTGYVYSGDVVDWKFRTDDIDIDQQTGIPAIVGRIYKIIPKGIIGSKYNGLISVAVNIIANRRSIFSVISKLINVIAGSSVNIAENVGSISLEDLNYDETYRYEVSATVRSYYVDGNGQLKTHDEVVKKLSNEFTVVDEEITTPISAEFVNVYVDEITSTTAGMNYRCNLTGCMNDQVSESGIKLYDKDGNFIGKTNVEAESYSGNYNYFYTRTKLHPITGLTANTTYQAQMYAIVAGKEYVSKIVTFKTLSEGTAASGTINATYTVTISDVTAATASLSYRCDLPSNMYNNVVSRIGMFLYDEEGYELGEIYTNSDPDLSGRYTYFYNNDIPIESLEPETDYSVRVYSVVSGQVVMSDYSSFTTNALVTDTDYFEYTKEPVDDYMLVMGGDATLYTAPNETASVAQITILDPTSYDRTGVVPQYYVVYADYIGTNASGKVFYHLANRRGFVCDILEGTYVKAELISPFVTGKYTVNLTTSSLLVTANSDGSGSTARWSAGTSFYYTGDRVWYDASGSTLAGARGSVTNNSFTGWANIGYFKYDASHVHTFGAYTADDEYSHSRVCTDCGYEEVTDHTIVNDAGHGASCTEPGLTDGTHCSVCGAIITEQEVIPATGHQHTEIRNAVAATADHEGYTGDTYCVDCNTLLQSGTVIPRLTPVATELSLQIYGSSFKVDGKRKINQYRGKFMTGTEHTVIYTGSDFLYWTDITGMVLSENAEYTFTFMSTTTLFAVTKNTEADIASVLILTGSGSGQIVTADSVTASEVTTLEIPAVGNFSGYVFSGWTVIDIDNGTDITITSGDNSEVYNCMASLINSGVKNIVLKPYYEVANANEIHTVTVIYECGSTTTSKQYSVAGDRVKVYTADSTYLGQAFAGWYLGGNLVCPNIKYVALVDKDITITVKYSNDDTVVSRPFVENISYTVDNSTGTNKLVHLTLHNVPDEYDVIGYGTIYSISVSSAADLTIENVDGSAVRKIEKYGSQNGIMTSNITVGNAVSTIVYVRGYVTVKDASNNALTYYTDVLSGSFNSLNNAGGNDSGGGEI